MAKGDTLTPEVRQNAIDQMSRLTGLSKESFIEKSAGSENRFTFVKVR